LGPLVHRWLIRQQVPVLAQSSRTLSPLGAPLRKAGATIAANNGATADQLMAIFGWDTLKDAEKYTAKGISRKALCSMGIIDH
jgi:hypothetical protein